MTKALWTIRYTSELKIPPHILKRVARTKDPPILIYFDAIRHELPKIYVYRRGNICAMLDGRYNEIQGLKEFMDKQEES